ncbi:hypothetical protein JZ751_009751 [Albula glossodonta]|uniref:Peptide-N-glycosidase F N-terminal domain-containing protein n=1 Tax=Albula glossodonta TaxID=121402 RepID=A0A8T2P0D7_9TELE|nr:hypothetical protein JZ751_009751 [Albula glossodonta]
MVLLYTLSMTFCVLIKTSGYEVLASGRASASRIRSNLVRLSHRDDTENSLGNSLNLGRNANLRATINFKSRGNASPISIEGFEPGDTAPEFQIKTLDGEFVYPPRSGLNISLIIHAFTNKSAFLECLWTSLSSLSDLVQYLPESCHVLFLTFDDMAARDALWMQEQIHRAATLSHRKDVLSRLHISPVPVYALGNWIPNVLYSWGCSGHNCGLAQVAFTSTEWDTPVVAKRLDARYDWLMGRWDQRSYRVIDAGDGCEPCAALAGAVAWVSEGNCSFFTKVQNMAKSMAAGVLVYASLGNPIQDMNCEGEECGTPLGIPASMVHVEPAVVSALLRKQPVNASFQITPSANFFFGIDQQGALAQMGWFLYPTFRFFGWQAQWFDYLGQLQERLRIPAQVVTVFHNTLMHGDKGAIATVELQADMVNSDVLELEVALSCPGRRDETCPHWDHTVQLFVCCDYFSPYCNRELGRWITAFRRGIGHWLTDVSPLLPLLTTGKCTFTMKTVPWAMPWMASLNLRFRSSNYSGSALGCAARVVEGAVPNEHGTWLYGRGGWCDGLQVNPWIIDISSQLPGARGQTKERAYNCRRSTQCWLVAQIRGHGAPAPAFALNYAVNRRELSSPSAPSANSEVQGLNMTGSNTILYFGLYEGQDPDPRSNPGYIIMSSYLVLYN